MQNTPRRHMTTGKYFAELLILSIKRSIVSFIPRFSSPKVIAFALFCACEGNDGGAHNWFRHHLQDPIVNTSSQNIFKPPRPNSLHTGLLSSSGENNAKDRFSRFSGAKIGCLCKTGSYRREFYGKDSIFRSELFSNWRRNWRNSTTCFAIGQG